MMRAWRAGWVVDGLLLLFLGAPWIFAFAWGWNPDLRDQVRLAIVVGLVLLPLAFLRASAVRRRLPPDAVKIRRARLIAWGLSGAILLGFFLVFVIGLTRILVRGGPLITW